MVRERVYRFTVPPLRSFLDYFGPDTTPAAHARVAIDPERSFSFAIDPVFLALCLRLLGTTERIQRIGDDAGRVLGPGVISSERLVVGRERGLAEPQSFAALPEASTNAARLRRTRLVLGCSGPSTFSWIASARSKSGRAAARSPWA